MRKIEENRTVHLTTIHLSPFYLEASNCHGRVKLGLVFGLGLVFESGLVFGLGLVLESGLVFG